jgi:hypothetical protein
VTLRVAVDGQLLGTPSAPTVCDGLPSTVRATVVDVATGAPVKGYLLVVSQQPTPPTSPTLLSRSVTDVSGGTRDDHVLAAATTYTVAGPAQGSFQGAGATGQVVPITCVTALDGTAVSSLSPAYGTVVTVRGSLHRPAGATSIGIAGQLVTVTLTTPAHGTTPAATRTLSSARTSADSGDPNFALAFQASTSGELRLTYLASRGATAASVDLGPLTVAIPNTTLTARASTDHVRAGQPVSVTGTLTTAGVAIPGASITVYLVPASGAAILIGTATVTSTGTYTLTAPVFGAGTLVAGYAGGARLSAARAVAGKVTIDT